MGKLDGRVAFITGVGRGQGRAHAIRLAEEGADIIALDICAPIDSVPYALASEEDLAETVRLVEARGRGIVARRGDVRSRSDQQRVLDEGLTAFGRLDFAIANAGIFPVPADGTDEEDAWRDAIDVLLTGVWHTLKVVAPPMIAGRNGGSIVLTSSTAGLLGTGDEWGGLSAYVAAKHGVIGLMRSYANLLAPHSIRVNTVHPSGVDTTMITNDAVAAWVPTSTFPPNALPVGMLSPDDVSQAVLWLFSDDSRYVTGVQLPVDAGLLVNVAITAHGETAS